jgi:nucleotide-binding universal stress UspA family protein
MFKHILVPTDGSELSTKTVIRAIKFAKESGAKITFFYSKLDYMVAFYTGTGGGAMDASTVETINKTGDDQAEQILAACEKLAQDAGVRCVRSSTVNDSPYQGIIDAASSNGCDLIFMASHGRHGFNALLLGSETNKVLTHSAIPVLVYR